MISHNIYVYLCIIEGYTVFAVTLNVYAGVPKKTPLINPHEKNLSSVQLCNFFYNIFDMPLSVSSMQEQHIKIKATHATSMLT